MLLRFLCADQSVFLEKGSSPEINLLFMIYASWPHLKGGVKRHEPAKDVTAEVPFESHEYNTLVFILRGACAIDNDNGEQRY